VDPRSIDASNDETWFHALAGLMDQIGSQRDDGDGQEHRGKRNPDSDQPHGEEAGLMALWRAREVGATRTLPTTPITSAAPQTTTIGRRAGRPVEDCG
jgi:hypothetical protein